MRIFINIKSLFYQICHTAQCSLANNLVRTNKLNALASCLVVFASALVGQQARACSLNVTGVNFDNYDVFSDTALQSTGKIYVNCASGVGYNISINAGNGTYYQRVMKSGSQILNYNLYIAPNHAIIWGKGTNGTATVSGSGADETMDHVIYGRIPPNQNVYPGSYSDTITVEITF